DLVLPLFRDDRNARRPHDRGVGHHDLAARYLHEGSLRTEVLQPCGDIRIVLALCRHRLDLPIPATVSDLMEMHMDHTHEHTEHHVASNGMYFGIFFILMICTGLTYFVWTIELGFLNILVALGIAIFKATLVIRYFMHIKWSPLLSKVALLIAITFLGI